MISLQDIHFIQHAVETNPNKEKLDESYPTRKHFREVANTVRAIEDPKKRQEFANHHAAIYAKQNPRFSHAKWHAACGTHEVKEETIAEVAPKGPGFEHWVHGRKADFKKRYGDRWERVLYATAWKMKHKHPGGLAVRHPNEEVEAIVEAWGTDYETPKSKRGMFKGRSLSSLKSQAKHAHGTKAKQVNFAIRAKTGWGKTGVAKEEVEKKEVKGVKSVKVKVKVKLKEADVLEAKAGMSKGAEASLKWSQGNYKMADKLYTHGKEGAKRAFSAGQMAAAGELARPKDKNKSNLRMPLKD